MAKYVRLGKKSKGGSFYEPANQVSLYGAKVQKISAQAYNHKIVRRAINAGAIELDAGTNGVLISSTKTGSESIKLESTGGSILIKPKDKNALEINRVAEINKWLKDHQEVTHWVAVDDLDLSKLKNFVHTPYQLEGIKQIGIAEKILRFF